MPEDAAVCLKSFKRRETHGTSRSSDRVLAGRTLLLFALLQLNEHILLQHVTNSYYDARESLQVTVEPEECLRWK